MELATSDYVLLLLIGLITGFSKFSVGGMGMLILPLLMIVIPGPAALGALVPMYVATDIFAVSIYRKSINWGVLIRFLPPLLIGLVVGAWVIADISLSSFSWLIGGTILFILSFSWWLDNHNADFMRHPVMTNLAGFISGLLSLAASAAGPFVSIYLLEQRLSKESYVSTRAFIFFLVNIAKVPILMVLGYINWETTLLGFQLLPAVLVGACVGFLVLRKLDITHFKWLIRGLAAIAAVKLLVFPG